MKWPCHSLRLSVLMAVLWFALSAAQTHAIIVDGTADAAYGPALAVQNTQTGFGKNTLGDVAIANGSELDQAFATIQGGTLYLTLAGNLETNFNKLDIFFDTGITGQNELRGDNSNIDFNLLNRMGDDGSGNGLRFDTGFNAAYWISVTVGGLPTTLYANYAVLLPTGGGPGYYVGRGTPGGGGTLSAGINPNGIRVDLNNSSTAGVTAGTGLDSGAGVTTGVELAIPLLALGNPSGPIKISAFINTFQHDFVSNQLLGGIGGGDNLGEARNVDFSAIAGDQFFIVIPEPATSTLVGLGVLGILVARRLKA